MHEIQLYSPLFSAWEPAGFTTIGRLVPWRFEWKEDAVWWLQQLFADVPVGMKRVQRV